MASDPSLSVLIVEDNATDVNLYKQYLSLLPHYRITPHQAASLADAIEFLKSNPVKVVLLDYHLPDGEGTDLLRWLATEREEANIATIMITGEDDVSVVTEVLKLGAVDYLIKGRLSVESISRSIHIALGKIHLNERLREKDAENRLYFCLLNELQDSAFILSAETGTIIKGNKSAVKMLGVTTETLPGMNFIECVTHFSTSAEWRFIWEKFGIDQSFELSTYLLGPENIKVPVEMRAKKILSDGDEYVVVSLRDVSRQRSIEDKLRRAAITDSLTGLYNRGHFNKLLMNELKRKHREGNALSVIMLDVDFFKKYNDRYGHLAGDECLKKVASVLKSCVQRPGDFVARYGGEEFVCILPNTGLQGAAQIARVIQAKLHECHLEFADSPFENLVTVSMGLAESAATESHDMDSLLITADKALYKAKETRNTFVLADKPAGTS